MSHSFNKGDRVRVTYPGVNQSFEGKVVLISPRQVVVETEDAGKVGRVRYLKQRAPFLAIRVRAAVLPAGGDVMAEQFNPTETLLSAARAFCLRVAELRPVGAEIMALTVGTQESAFFADLREAVEREEGAEAPAAAEALEALPEVVL